MTTQTIPQLNGGVPLAALIGTELFECAPASGPSAPTSSATIQTYARNQGIFSTPLATTGVAATDTANLIAAINLAASSARSLVGASDPVGTAVIYFGPGTFTINSANALMGPATLSAKLRGLMLVGCGAGQTQLVFSPSVAGPMMTNQRWQSITTIDMGFSCTVAGCDFLQSQEQGSLTNIQQFTWVRCGWSGFKKDFFLTGGNNNSEWIWDACAFGATAEQILYTAPTATVTITASNPVLAVANSPEIIPLGATGTFTATLGNLILNTTYFVVASTATGISLAATAGGAAITPTAGGTLSFNDASDQFLNFSFHNCKYDPGTSTAPWVTLNKGGSVSFSGFTDVSGWAPAVDTYLFNLMGNAHASGVQSFKVDKLRMEGLTDHALILQSQWASGNVSIRNLDPTSHTQTSTVKSILINLTNVAGPIYEFGSCGIPGQLSLVAFGNSLLQARIGFSNCAVLQWPNANAYVAYTLTGNVNNLPLIDFDLTCRGNDPTEIFPTTLNWHLSPTSVCQPKTVNFVGSGGAPLSLGNIQRKLPPNARLSSASWNLGGTTAGAYGYAFQTIEATPTTLSTFVGANAATPANPAPTPLNFWMLSDVQRTIQLVETAGRSATFGSYIATVTYDG